MIVVAIVAVEVRRGGGPPNPRGVAIIYLIDCPSCRCPEGSGGRQRVGLVGIPCHGMSAGETGLLAWISSAMLTG